VTKRGFRKYLPWIGLAALVGACYLVWLSVREYSVDEILGSIAQIPRINLALAAFFALASYATLTAYDWLSVRYAGAHLPYRKIALASFVSLSLGHSIGLAPLGSGALRARYYAGWGLDAEQIAKIVVFSTVTVTLGQVGFAGIVLVVEPGPVASWLHTGDASVRALGILCLAFNAIYVLLAALLQRPLRIRAWTFKLPRLDLALWQVGIGTLNFAFLAACLCALLTPATGAPYWEVATTQVLANIAALISHVPGGLGVIEWVVLSLYPQSGAFGALLVYRTVYYLVPLAIGGLLFATTAFRVKQPSVTVERSSPGCLRPQPEG
jgi:uncharacterized membrane protein YbhN (UPF0104 family)